MWHRMCNPLLIPSGLLGIPDTLFVVSVPFTAFDAALLVVFVSALRASTLLSLC